MDIEEKKEKEDAIHLYLYTAHGNNVSGGQNFYFPMETDFNSIIMHSQPFQPITTREFYDLVKYPCKLVLGSTPYIPIEYKNGRYVFLPPLIFNLNKNDKPDVIEAAGLYYIKLIKTNNKLCDIASSIKIYDHKMLINKFGNGKPIIYAEMFEMVKTHAKTINVVPEDIVLSIFSCQSIDEQYVKHENIKISNLIPKLINVIEPANIFDNNNYPKKTFINPSTSAFIIPSDISLNKLPHEWKTLILGRNTQMSAINLLYHFNIIDQHEARGRAACLSKNGMSIFKIIDYINYNLKPKPYGYIVNRFDIKDGLNVVISFLKSLNVSNNTGILFKMYEDKMTDTSGDIHIGRAAAIIKDNNGIIFYFDPTANLYFDIHNIEYNKDYNKLVVKIQKIYEKTWKFIDIIYNVFEYRFENTTPIEFSPLHNIISRKSYIRHGGVIKNKKNIRKPIKKRTRSINKMKGIYKKTNKTKK